MAYNSKRKFLDRLHALGLHPIGKLRRAANLRYLYQGPGRPKTAAARSIGMTCHALSGYTAKLHSRCSARMSALTLGKLEALQQSGNAQAGFSWRASNAAPSTNICWGEFLAI